MLSGGLTPHAEGNSCGCLNSRVQRVGAINIQIESSCAFRILLRVLLVKQVKLNIFQSFRLVVLP